LPALVKGEDWVVVLAATGRADWGEALLLLFAPLQWYMYFL
jgi:hypothetical protein